MQTETSAHQEDSRQSESALIYSQELRRYFLDEFFNHLDRRLLNIQANLERLFKLTSSVSVLMLTGWVTLFTTLKGIATLTLFVGCALPVSFLGLITYILWDALELGNKDLGIVITQRNQYIDRTLTWEGLRIDSDALAKPREKHLRLIKQGLLYFFVTLIGSFFLMLFAIQEAQQH